MEKVLVCCDIQFYTHSPWVNWAAIEGLGTSNIETRTRKGCSQSMGMNLMWKTNHKVRNSNYKIIWRQLHHFTSSQFCRCIPNDKPKLGRVYGIGFTKVFHFSARIRVFTTAYRSRDRLSMTPARGKKEKTLSRLSRSSSSLWIIFIFSAKGCILAVNLTAQR